MHNSPSPPFAGEMPKAEGGPCLLALSGHRPPTPPLSLRDISPRKGGRGDSGATQRAHMRGD